MKHGSIDNPFFIQVLYTLIDAMMAVWLIGVAYTYVMAHEPGKTWTYTLMVILALYLFGFFVRFILSLLVGVFAKLIYWNDSQRGG